MNSAFEELKEQLTSFGKKAKLINEIYNDFIYKGKPLLQNFDQLLNETIQISQQLYSDMNKLKDIGYNPNANKQKKQEYDAMQHEFFSFIDQVQDIQTKIIERKKENLRSYNKSLHQRQRSQISGLRSQMSLGTNNNLTESRVREKSFNTAQNDKSESFVRFSNQNSESTPNRLMYQESGGSSMLDEESSAQDCSDLDLSGDPEKDYDKILKKAEITENEINDQLSKLNLMKEIHNMIKREQTLREQQEEDEKKKYHSFSSGIESHTSSMNITTNVPKQSNTITNNGYKNQQSMAINNPTFVANQQTTIIDSQNTDTVYVKMVDPHNHDTNDKGTSYEQSKRKKYWIILIILIIIGATVGLVLGLK